ncbi:MAG: hypothetical protein GY787_18125 [Alteromonadales bacterium]|nr:hypothetical protein [Alteromonadales bacterium]
MQTIKFYKKYEVPFAKLNNVEYKGYTVGNIPNSFGFKFQGDKQGKSQWFNHKGLTYIEKVDLPW